MKGPSNEQGSRGRRILRPGTHKSGSGLLKIPQAESAGRMFFSRGTATNYGRIILLKYKVCRVLFVSLVVLKRTVIIRRVLFTPATALLFAKQVVVKQVLAVHTSAIE